MTWKTINKGNLSSFAYTPQKSSGAQVWRGVAAAATATEILQFWLGLSLGYGLDFLPGMLALERGMLP